MDTGYVKIVIEEGNAPYVEAQLVNGNIWISKWTMCQLFNCYYQKIDKNIAVFSNNVFCTRKMFHTHIVTQTKALKNKPNILILRF
jgi:hypothetical protein